MLEFLDKFSVYIVAAIIGYMAYSVTGQSQKVEVEEKGPTPITKKMLNPVFLEPVEHSSVANRDPFSVYWSSYIDKDLLENIAANFDSPDATPQQDAVVLGNQKLLAILNDREGDPIALIGENVYGVGAIITPEDITPAWKVEAIEEEQVILSNGHLRQVLTFSQDEGTSACESETPATTDNKMLSTEGKP